MTTHPNFAGQTANMIAAFDFTYSKKSMVLVPATHAVDLLRANGETVKHLTPSYCFKRSAATQLMMPPVNGTALWMEESAAHEAGYIFCYDRSSWVLRSRSSQGGVQQFGYKSCERADLTSYDDGWCIGLEVEKDSNREALMADYAYELMNNTKWAKERDGSLGSYGFELVSPRLPLNDDEIINDSLLKVAHLINSSASESCGGHIHLSHTQMDKKQVLQMFRQWACFLYAMYPKRCMNDYSKAVKWGNYFSAFPTRTWAFNMTNRESMEIRLFPAVANVAQLKWRIGFLRIILSQHFQNKRGPVYIMHKLLSEGTQLNKHFRRIYSREKLLQMAERACDMCTKYMDYDAKTVNKMREVVKSYQQENDPFTLEPVEMVKANVQI